MKVHKPIGSKERFLEMFQGVNKMNLNEGIGESGNIANDAFNELANGKLKIEQTNTQSSNGEDYVEIVGSDDVGNVATFKFIVTSTPGDQDGVVAVDSAKLISLDVKGSDYNLEMPEGVQAITVLNQERGQEMIDLVSEYVDASDDMPDISEEMYEEAVKFIDKVPYKKGTEEIQTNKAYADQKPTNDKLRVNSDQLDKFVSEVVGDLEDDMLPPDFKMPNISTTDDGTKGIDPMDEPIDFDDSEPVEAVSPEKAALINQAYDNLVAAGNQAPTVDDILREVDKIKGVTKNVEKTRAIPKGAEEFYEGMGHVVTDINADDVLTHGYNQLLPDEHKKSIIQMADEILSNKLGVKKFQMPKEQYIQMVKGLAIEIYHRGAAQMNEDAEKGEYPDQMGKKFKPKNQMPKKKKRPQSVVKLTEEEGRVPKPDYKHGIQSFDWTPDEKLRFMELMDAKGFRYEMLGNDGNDPNDGVVIEVGAFDDPEIKALMDSMKHYDPFAMEEDVEQVEKEKEEVGDVIAGGKADGKSPEKFDQEQIKMGLKVEMEHTDDPMVAIEITMDHLTEFPDYYTRLDKMEKQAKGDTKSEGMVDSTPEEEETTDQLLGFKPHNVGDYVDESEWDIDGDNYWEKELNNNEPIPDEEEYGEPSPEDLYGDVTVSHGERKPYGGLLGEEEEDLTDYQGEVGDRYQDGKGNQLTVKDDIEGGVKLQGQDGESEIATQDIKYLKQLEEENGGGKYSTVEKTKYGMTYLFAFPDPSGIESEEGLNGWESQDPANRELYFVDSREAAVDGLESFQESKKSKPVITEEMINKARRTLNKRGLNEGMTKKEAVQLLIKHNIK